MKSLLEIGVQKIVSVAAESGGRYGWCSTTKMRWRQFCMFCDSVEVFSISQITPEVLQKYADVRCKNLAVATAQNYLSSVNAVLKLIDPSWVLCSPRKLIDRSRTFVRTIAVSFNAKNIDSVARELENLGSRDLSFLVQLSSEFGLRRREAALLHIPNALKEARKFGAIDIQRGTKGGRGRSIERWVPCSDTGIILLECATHFLDGVRCLVPNSDSLKTFYDRISNNCLHVLRRNSIGKLHDLRVFYACRRYTEITGCLAPCNRVTGDSIATHELDELARKIISNELGHARVQIVSSYIGRKPKRSTRCE